MLQVVETKRAEIAALCRRCKVRRLHLFGSAATGKFALATSDLDFIVEFQPLAPVAYAQAFFDLWEGLEGLFARQVDLITEPSVINPYFSASISATRQALYAA